MLSMRPSTSNRFGADRETVGVQDEEEGILAPSIVGAILVLPYPEPVEGRWMTLQLSSASQAETPLLLTLDDGCHTVKI